MQFFPSVLYGISSSLDTLLVGISLGLRGVRVLFWQNCLISFITLLGTCLSVGLGARLGSLLPASAAVWGGSLVLMLLGLYIIARWFIAVLRRKREKVCQSKGSLTSCAVPPSSLTLSQTLLFGVSLSANNIGMGLAASMTGLTVSSAALSTVICSILFLLIGNRLGASRLLLFIGRFSDPLSGILLLGMGLIMLL
jgi:putative Mn2+ efflux pump MntP